MMGDSEIRVQPHSVEAEEGLIAAMLLEGGGDILAECRAMQLTVDSLYKTSHQAIYRSLCEMSDKGIPLGDEVSLLEYLRKSGLEEEVGGIAAIYAIQDRIETPAHARYHAKIVMDKHLSRMLIRNSRQIIEACYGESEEPHILAAKGEEFLRAITERDTIQGSGLIRADELVDVATSNLIERMNASEDEEKHAIETNLCDLNGYLTAGGFLDGQLVVIGARPSVGKSALAMNFGDHAATENGHPVAVFTLEMTDEELINRTACTRARVDSKRVSRALINGQEQKDLAEAYKALKKSPLYIDSTPAQTIFDIRNKCHKLNRKLNREGKRLRMVIIDYIQLVEGSDPRKERHLQVAEASRNAKRMAKELKCPVVILSQLNREGEKTGAEPRLSNLRESGDIEQDADIVILLHRMKQQSDECIVVEDEDIKLIIAKQRGGPLADFMTTFERKYTKFTNHKRH